MMKKVVELYCHLPKGIRKPLWQVWHNMIIKFDKNAEAVFMNYGYEPMNGGYRPNLKEKDEINRYCIQLYDFVVNQADLKGKAVVEVGSGRGGGASYISRYFQPKSYMGVDISQGVIDFCNNYHEVEGLSFKRGIAEDLPLEDNTYDALVNVESARCYSSLATFFAEVYRVLKPGGHFLFADMIEKEDVDEVDSTLRASGLEYVNSTDFTENVVEALDKDHERRDGMISNKVPGFLKGAFAEFAGTKGSNRYELFASGNMRYKHYIMRKPM